MTVRSAGQYGLTGCNVNHETFPGRNINMDIDLKNSVLLKTLTPLRPYLATAGAFSFFINILMIVPAIYMLQVYDRAVGSQSLATLAMLTLIMVGLLIAMGGLDWVRGQIMNRAGARLDEILSEQVFEKTFLNALFSGGRGTVQPLMDISGLRVFIGGAGINAVFDTPWILIYILIMFAFHPYFGMMAIASVILLGTLTWLNQRTTRSDIEDANNEQLWARNFANSHLRNAEVIEAMGMMNDVRNHWSQRNQLAVGLQGTAAEKAGMFASSSKAIRIILQSLALGLGAYLVIKLEISPGMMIAGSILLGRALAPVDQLVGGWKGFQQAYQQYTRLEKLLRTIPSPNDKMNLPAPKGALSVEAIQVAPPGGRLPVLKNVSFKLEAGAALGVIGPSAAGKSTLARTILGLWPAVTGAVRIDGADIFKWDRSDLGKYIGYLPQDIELFDGTIAENIARFGEISSEKIVDAARMAGVHEMVLRLPEGYDTVIDAGGGKLAGGQRQRIALARALYGKPILVVLDEPNSNLDDVGENALRMALQQLKAERITLVIITHRSSILSLVDSILVLNNGIVADFGLAKLIMQKYQKSYSKNRLA